MIYIILSLSNEASASTVLHTGHRLTRLDHLVAGEPGTVYLILVLGLVSKHVL
jgi:hypothetical protein